MTLDNHIRMDDRHAAFLAGVHYGITLGTQQVEADMAAAWAAVAHTVHAAAKLEPWTTHEQARKARQVAVCEANQAAARPWPDEAPNPSARVLNGWPDWTTR